MVMVVCCKFDGRLGFGVSVEIRVLLVNMMLVDVGPKRNLASIRSSPGGSFCKGRHFAFFLSL